jgi:hypothetical protein
MKKTSVNTKKFEKVMAEIDASIATEEMAIPIYASHLSAAFSWSGLSSQVQKEIVKGLKTLSRESLGHVRLLKDVRRMYKQSQKKM